MKVGDCVKLPDGRIARVRRIRHDTVQVRVRRTTSKTNQFLNFRVRSLVVVQCPNGWMTPQGYVSYLTKTLSKMRRRLRTQLPRGDGEDEQDR